MREDGHFSAERIISQVKFRYVDDVVVQDLIRFYFEQTPDGRTVIKEITEFKVRIIISLPKPALVCNNLCLYAQTDESGNRVKCTRRIHTTKKTVRVNRCCFHPRNCYYTTA